MDGVKGWRRPKRRRHPSSHFWSIGGPWPHTHWMRSLRGRCEGSVEHGFWRRTANSCRSLLFWNSFQQPTTTASKDFSFPAAIPGPPAAPCPAPAWRVRLPAEWSFQLNQRADGLRKVENIDAFWLLRYLPYQTTIVKYLAHANLTRAGNSMYSKSPWGIIFQSGV